MDLDDELNARGFCKFRSLIGDALVADARRAVTSRLGGTLEDSDTWQPMAERCSRGFAPIWNHERLWDIRQNARLFALFAGLLQSSDLWVSIDRCHFKPPLDEADTSSAQALSHFAHWDVPDERWPFVPLQGVLALADTEPSQGAFTCAPSLYQTYVRQGERSARARQARGDYEEISVGCKAGDFIVWDYRLFHGNAPNLSTKPRLAFYVTMFPAGSDTDRQRRIAAWRTGEWLYGPTSDMGFDRPDQTKSPRLAPLGRQVLGISLCQVCGRFFSFREE